MTNHNQNVDSTAHHVSMDDIDSSSCHVADNNEEKGVSNTDMVIIDTLSNDHCKNRHDVSPVLVKIKLTDAY